MQDESARQAVGKLGEFAYWPKESEGMTTRSATEVIKDIIANVQEIIRSEVRLAKAEVREETGKALTAARMLVVGAVAGLYALGFILWSIAYGLSAIVPAWAAALIVGGVLGIAAAIMISTGREKLKHVSAKPDKTIQNVKENVEWMKSQTRS